MYIATLSNLSNSSASICTLLSTKMTIPDILSTRYYHAKKQTNMEQPTQAKTRITLPCIHTASEMASGLLRPH